MFARISGRRVDHGRDARSTHLLVISEGSRVYVEGETVGVEWWEENADREKPCVGIRARRFKTK